MKTSLAVLLLVTVGLCGLALSQVVPLRKKNHVPITKPQTSPVDTSTRVTIKQGLVVQDAQLIAALRSHEVQYDEQRLGGWRLQGWTRKIHTIESAADGKHVKVWVIPRVYAGQAMVCTAQYEEEFVLKDGELTLIKRRPLRYLIAGC